MPAVPQRMMFAAIRKGSEIGSHDLVFERKGEDLLVRVDVQIKVGLGPIALFRYRHQAIERWRGADFVAMESTTDNNGTPIRLSARRNGDRVDITSSTLGALAMPGNALPLSHWNIQCMSSPVFNPQDGTALDGAVRPGNTETVTLGDGRQISARRFLKAGTEPIEDWYDEADMWCRLRATAKDGSIVEYRRTA